MIGNPFGALFASSAFRPVGCAMQGADAEHDVNKATAGGQKEGAKGSFAAAKVWLQDHSAAVLCCHLVHLSTSLYDTAGTRL